MRSSAIRAVSVVVVAALLAGSLPGCASLEPRSSEPVPAQIAKGIIYYPLMIALVFGSLIVEDEIDEWAEGDDDCSDRHRDHDRDHHRPHHGRGGGRGRSAVVAGDDSGD